jgi:hypothetical protein
MYYIEYEVLPIMLSALVRGLLILAIMHTTYVVVI